MKLIRFSVSSESAPLLGVLTDFGILDIAEALKACKSVEFSFTSIPDLFADNALPLLREAADWALENHAAHPAFFCPVASATIHAPIARPPKIICIGLNYRDHALETGKAIPDSPVVFTKFPTAVQAPGKPIILPKITEQLDYEAELGVVIGKGGRNIAQENALDHVAGYLNVNDVSARDVQAHDGQWIRAKSCDTFAPMGPVLVTRDEIADPQNLRVSCRVNGKTMQDSNTREMIFPVDYLISFLSEFTTLEVGDVIATGTPPGVGVARKPQVFLQPGDVVEIEVEGLGVLQNSVAAEK